MPYALWRRVPMHLYGRFGWGHNANQVFPQNQPAKIKLVMAPMLTATRIAVMQATMTVPVNTSPSTGAGRRAIAILRELHLQGCADLGSNKVALETLQKCLCSPFCSMLRTLDMSACVELDDWTMQMIASHVPTSLRVLRLRDLVQLSGAGFSALAERCCGLRELVISGSTSLRTIGGNSWGTLQVLEAAGVQHVPACEWRSVLGRVGTS